MTEIEKNSIKNVSSELDKRHRKFIEADYHLQNDRLLRERRKLMDEGAISSEAWIEASPSYKFGNNLEELNLPESVKDLLISLSEDDLVFDPPYEHQAEALEEFFYEEKDLIVSTGTGSGKTEIFLYSILGQLAQESHRDNSTGQRGMRSLILYPMNALVADQLSRMRELFGDENGEDILEDRFGRNIQFGMYTGRTPYHGRYDVDKNSNRIAPIFDQFIQLKENKPELFNQLKSNGKIPTKNLEDFRNKGARRETQFKTQPGDTELFTRQEMHSGNEHGGTPDILITNYSMLEYMLLRPIEQDIFEDTRKWLEEDEENELTVVLDEAHLYRGAQGAEVSLLIRRLLQHLNVEDSRVRFILTSATFGGNVEEIAPEFAAQLTTAESSNFSVITGAKQSFADGSSGNKEIAQAFRSVNYQVSPSIIADLAQKRGWSGSVPEDEEELKVYLGKKLENDEMFREAHEFLKENPKKLSELAERLFPSCEDQLAEDAAGNIVYLATEAAKPGQESASLLPVSLHKFLKGLPTLYICLNDDCNGKRADGEGSLGRIFTNPRMSCPHCDKRVFELLSHRTCGAAYIKAFRHAGGSGPTFLWSDAENNMGLEEIHIFVGEPREDIEASEKGRKRYLDTKTGYLVQEPFDGEENRFKQVYIPPVDEEQDDPMKPTSWTKCPSCGIYEQRRRGGRTKIQDLGTKGEPIFANLIRTTFELQPNDPDKEELPNEGKKLLAFSDGRQKAARLARDLQQNVENDSFREVLADVVSNYPSESSLDSLFPAFTIYCKKNNIVFFDDEDRKSRQDEIVYPGSRSKFEDIQERIPELKERYGIESDEQMVENELIRNELSERPSKYDSALLRALGDENYSIWATLVGYLRPVTEVMEGLEEDIDELSSEILEEIVLEVIRHAAQKRAIDPEINRYQRMQSKGYPEDNWGMEFDELVPEYVQEKVERISENQWNNLSTKFINPENGDRALFKPDGDARYMLNPEAVKVELAVDENWYRCEGCNRFSISPIEGKCPYEDCDGEMEVPGEDDLHMEARKSLFRDPPEQVVKDERDPFTLRSEEHSAQLNAKDYDEPFSTTEQYELLFQDILLDEEAEQPIDVLSCTTTMEVGIDIGSLTAVGMRTVPPNPENYDQRAGRAGRRGSGLSTILTFADNRPHPTHYFENPEKLIRGDASEPIIYSGNKKISKRHINASLLAGFFDPDEINSEAAVFESLGTSREFFTEDGEHSLSEFEEWVEDEIFSENSETAQKLGDLLPSELGENLEHDSWRENFVKETAEQMLNDLRDLDSKTDWKHSEGDENLLDTLLDDALLPTFSFPIDLSNFVIPEIGENQMPTKRYEMSRDLKQALSTYVPGRQLVVDKKTYTSYGVYFPFADDPIDRASGVDWAGLKWMNFCPVCESVYEETESNLAEEGETCDFCEEPLDSIKLFRPPAFSPEVKPDTGEPEEGEEFEDENIYAKPAKYPIPPGGNVNQDEGEVKDIDGCSIRNLSDQKLFVGNFGPSDEGFSVCTRCGAVSREGDLGDHNRPYPKDIRAIQEEDGDWEPRCSGSTTNTVFGYRFPSDLTSYRIPIEDPVRFVPGETWFESAAESFSEALVLGSSRELNIETNELNGGFRVLPSSDEETEGYVEFFLFDTTPGGAGFASKIWENFESVLDRAEQILSECSCHNSCHSCLRTYENRHLHDKLDRHLGLSLLEYARGGTPSVSKGRKEKFMDQLEETLSLRLRDSGVEALEINESGIWRLEHDDNSINVGVRSCLRKERLNNDNIDYDISDYQLTHNMPRETERIKDNLRYSQ